jgi:ADP-ribosylglycohydrolase
VRVCTRITHTDPRAEAGALAVAWAARYAVRTAGSPPDAGGYLALLRSEAGFAWPAGWPGLLDRVADSLARGEPTGTFAANLCGRRGVSGFVNQTVPVALHAWFRHADDFRESVTTVIRCGGDTDTTAAVTGALAGARLGRQRLPADWLARVCEWPRTPAWVEALARRTAEALAAGTPRLSPPMRGAWAMPARNLFFFAVVLAHVFRRWLPPY